MDRPLVEVQEYVYQIRSAGKIHLDTNCMYLRNRDDYRKVPSKSLNGHKEVCGWCEDYFERWDDSVSLSSQETQCERCGKRNIDHSYCNECLRQIKIGR